MSEHDPLLTGNVTDADEHVSALEEADALTHRLYEYHLDGSLSDPSGSFRDVEANVLALQGQCTGQDPLLLYDFQASATEEGRDASRDDRVMPGRSRAESGVWGGGNEKPLEFRRKLRRPLQTAGRKERRQAQWEKKMFRTRDEEDSKIWRMSAYCTCAEFDLEKMLLHLDSAKALQKFEFSISYYLEDVIRLINRTTQQVVFIFEYGCLTLFNLREADERMLARSLQRYGSGLLVESDWSFEDFSYGYSDNFSVKNDTLQLRSHGSLEKLSVSYALAQCVKLSVFERRAEDTIEANRSGTEALAVGANIEMSRSEVEKRMGRLFLDRSDINLHSDILATPEFFWERDKFVVEYDELCKYLEIGSRVELLNNRLNIMKDLFSMLGAHLDRTKSDTRQSWMLRLLAAQLVVVFVYVVWRIVVKDIMAHHG